jgi:hypothetical protein
MYSKSSDINSRVKSRLGCGVAERTRNYEGGNLLSLLNPMNLMNPMGMVSTIGSLFSGKGQSGGGQVGGALNTLRSMGANKKSHPYYHHYMALKGSGVAERTRNYEGSGVAERTRSYEGSGVAERTRNYEGAGPITDFFNMINPLQLVGLGKKKRMKRGTSMRGRKVAELMRSKGLTLGQASKELKSMGY